MCLKDYTMLSNSGWEFKFFNKPIPVTIEARLLAEIQSLMTSKSIANIIDLFKQDYFKEIRDIYNRVFTKAKLHETCLVLLHYPSIIPSFSYAPYSVFYPNSSALPFPYDFRHYFYPYTLLTGDIMFDPTFASEIISNYPTGISGFVQVPHHGSAKNSISLLSNFPIFNCYVTPFGVGNIYGHPDPSLKIKIHPISYYEVTDYSGFPYWIFI